MPHTSSQTFRRALIEAHLIGWMVALPGQLFTHTPIPACIWQGSFLEIPHAGWSLVI